MNILTIFRSLDRFLLIVSLVRVLRGCLLMFDILLDTFFGYKITEGSKRDQDTAKNYEHSAQIIDIWIRAPHVTGVTRIEHFLCTHNRYVHPDYALKNDNVLFMGLTETHAFFSITHNPEFDLRNVAKLPLFAKMQHTYTEQLLKIPLSSFHRLADELGDPKGFRSICVVDTTGRSGSTLLCQMMYKIPKTRVISECWGFADSRWFHQKGSITFDQHRKNFQSIMRLLCKPSNDIKFENIFIKMPPLSIPNQIILKELFPQFKSIYITRNPKSVCLSLLKLHNTLPKFIKINNLAINSFLDNFPIPYNGQRRQLWIQWVEEARLWMNTYDYPKISCLIYVAITDYYLQRKSTFDGVFLYDDLIADPKKEMGRLLKLINVDSKHIPKTLEAMKTDSQRGIFGNRGNFGCEITQSQWEKVDKLMSDIIPGLTSNIPLQDLRNLLQKE